ncbi:MAG: helix-turn-helix domain-containing protein [Deltaproteobacteria bacterium]|nr:helix-turn-helix domain-containing protein [Deltaproteobacteria bacterium]
MHERWQIRPDIRKLAAEAQRGGPLVVVAAAGKGGVGTSLVLANLGLFFAQIGKRVLLIDMARGGGNLHAMVGHSARLEGPEPGAGADELAARIEETPIANLAVVPARPADRRRAPSLGWRGWLEETVARLLPRFDAFLFDCGAWPRREAFDLFVHAAAPIVVCAPEPTAVESTLGFLREATNRFLASEPERGAFVREVLAATGHAPPTPAEVLERVADRDEAAARELFRHVQSFVPGLVVNQVRVRGDFDLGPAVESVARRILGIPLRFLASIEADDAIWKSVRSGRPLLVEAPSSKPAREIERIARWILLPDAAPRPGAPRLREPGRDASLYEVLELDRGASEEEVRRAYRRAKDLYSGQHVATRGHVAAADQRRALARAEEAYETLVDSKLRRPYDRTLSEEEGPEAPPPPGPTGAGPGRTSGTAAPADRLQLEEGTEYTGALLRELRRRRGMERDDVAAVTRIGTAYLRAIEEEDFDALPEEVFLKGYLRQVARVLGLPDRDVVDTFLRRFRAGRRRQARRP